MAKKKEGLFTDNWKKDLSGLWGKKKKKTTKTRKSRKAHRKHCK